MDKQIFHGEICNILPRRKETLSVDVRENDIEKARKQLVVFTLDADDQQSKGNVAVANMCPNNARGLAELLWDAAAIAELLESEPHAGIIGVRQLPTIMLCGMTFFIDDQLRQLRNAENPMHCFDLDDPMMK